MAKRRRYATREELLGLLAGRGDGIDWPAVLTALHEIGVKLDLLVKIEVDEEV
jgi:hypothetical protein